MSVQQLAPHVAGTAPWGNRTGVSRDVVASLKTCNLKRPDNMVEQISIDF